MKKRKLLDKRGYNEEETEILLEYAKKCVNLRPAGQKMTLRFSHALNKLEELLKGFGRAR